eukprot:scaffold186751_cov15-Tisochrysis_lutea.AAC.1
MGELGEVGAAASIAGKAEDPTAKPKPQSKGPQKGGKKKGLTLGIGYMGAEGEVRTTDEADEAASWLCQWLATGTKLAHFWYVLGHAEPSSMP